MASAVLCVPQFEPISFRRTNPYPQDRDRICEYLHALRRYFFGLSCAVMRLLIMITFRFIECR